MKLDPKKKPTKTLKEISEEYNKWATDYLKRLDRFEEASRKVHLEIGAKK